MTIEQKVAPKAIPSKASNPTAKRTAATRKPPAKRTTTIKTPFATALALEKKAAEQEVIAAKAVKSGKVKMERDSFTMPRDEYAQLAALKARLLALGQPAKKSELLRAGIKLLAAMTDLRLKKAMADVPVIKTGRPKKKK